MHEERQENRSPAFFLFQREEALHKCGFHGEHLLANGELNTNVFSSLVNPTDSAIAKSFVIDCDTFLHLRVIECRSLRFFDLGLRRSNRSLDAVSCSDQIRLLLFWLRLRLRLRFGSDRGSRHDLFFRLRSDRCEGGNFLGSLHGCLLIVEQPLVFFTLDNSVPTTDVFTFVAVDTSVGKTGIFVTLERAQLKKMPDAGAQKTRNWIRSNSGFCSEMR